MAKPVATLAALEGICCLGRETAIAATFFGRRAGAKQFLSEWNGGICQNEKPALSQLPVMFEEIGWGARIRTWEWRNQNPSKPPRDFRALSEIWDSVPTFAPLKSKGFSEFQNWALGA